ncbi:hypothetical protein MRY82_00910 [bacterium]|nr:hypothetical protein [bacterium]
MKKDIEQAWLSFKDIPFPKAALKSFDLVSLDSFMAGLLEKYIDSKFDREDVLLLKQLSMDLELKINYLKSENTPQQDLIDYFSQLRVIVQQVEQRF